MASSELLKILPWEDASLPAGSTLLQAVSRSKDPELKLLFDRSERVFQEIASRRLSRWVVTFSGGKDSTLTVLLATDFLSRMENPPNLDIVYADTLMEIPVMRSAADTLLRYVRRIARQSGLPIKVHVVTPKVADRFWVRMLGRGYPPPKPKFRWCTKRLKIAPSTPYVATGVPTAVLTGVRYGESAQRTGRLVASCTNGGECGQDYWAEKGPQNSNVTYFAPVIDWRTCKVWDFLHFVAPEAGWPTQRVFALYGDTNLRFGCWTCTLVKRDRTMEALIARDPASPLEALHEFRNQILFESALTKNRLWRKNHWGPLKLEFRRELFCRLRTLERATGLTLLTSREEVAIKKLWADYATHKRGRKPRAYSSNRA
jgi:DNA sulfur modification protein DndC